MLLLGNYFAPLRPRFGTHLSKSAALPSPKTRCGLYSALSIPPCSKSLATWTNFLCLVKRGMILAFSICWIVLRLISGQFGQISLTHEIALLTTTSLCDVVCELFRKNSVNRHLLVGWQDREHQQSVLK
jgi:hypothetical protein